MLHCAGSEFLGPHTKGEAPDSAVPTAETAGEASRHGEAFSTSLDATDRTVEGRSEVQIHLSTNLPDIFRLPDQPFVVPGSYRRLELSKLVNKLLEQQDDPDWPGHQPFDFLVDNKWFLRTSLEEYMHARGITSEVSLTLHYQLAVRNLGTEQLPRAADWISSLSFVPTENLLVEASYDGCCRLHHVSPSASHDSVSTSSAAPLLTLGLNRGPLTTSATFAAGAFLPPRSAQLLLGSSSGALYFVTCVSSSSASDEKAAVSEARAPGRWHAAVQAVGCLDSSVASVAVSTDGVTVASGDHGGNVYLWENFSLLTEAETQIGQWREKGAAQGDEQPEGEGGDGNSLSTKGKGTQGKKRRHPSVSRAFANEAESLFSCQEKEPKLRLRGVHTAPVSDVAFAPSHFRCVLYSASLDNSISAWDTLVGGAPLVTWPVSRGVTSLACQPSDGRVVCTAHEDGRLRLWDIRSGGGDAGGKAANGVLSLDANSRLDLRFTFGCPHARLCTQVRWLPRQPGREARDRQRDEVAGEHLLASVGQEGVVKLFDIRAPTLPLLTMDVQGATKSKDKKEDRSAKAVRLLTTAWLGPAKLATGGSDGVTRIHTFGSKWTGTQNE
ncbi:NLE (NUC135) domain-containing protein [Toxoplasma gondii VAND]|uniref:NLE (NUC135) domain-containing protein n=1 Tax=Toxoplasma gondii VAND TaxID=933077 RepID=A0A086PQ58_TOXGO|nr:NLE (NUC135) domain-containing protein [Toxoplasma gondii VAND]